MTEMGGNEDLAEWWGTQDCHDTAEALAEAVLAALEGTADVQ